MDSMKMFFCNPKPKANTETRRLQTISHRQSLFYNGRSWEARKTHTHTHTHTHTQLTSTSVIFWALSSILERNRPIKKIHENKANSSRLVSYLILSFFCGAVGQPSWTDEFPRSAFSSFFFKFEDGEDVLCFVFYWGGTPWLPISLVGRVYFLFCLVTVTQNSMPPKRKSKHEKKKQISRSTTRHHHVRPALRRSWRISPFTKRVNSCGKKKRSIAPWNRSN